MIEVLFHTCGSIAQFCFSKSKEEKSVDDDIMPTPYTRDIDIQRNIVCRWHDIRTLTYIKTHIRLMTSFLYYFGE